MPAKVLIMAVLEAPGFYGKVPTVGDFVSRRLSRNFIDPWDKWLQAAITCSRNQLKELWLDAYLISPVWRFALAEGVAGPLPCVGILMPSVDKVGRYFPLTLAAFLPAQSNVFELAGGPQKWFEAAEDIALSMLAEIPPDIEALDNSIVTLGQIEAPESGEPIVDDGSDPRLIHVSIPSVAGVQSGLSLITKRFATLHFGTYSLWWSAGSEQVEPAIMLCEGLPSEQGYAAMLCDDWQRFGQNQNVPKQDKPAL